jgi:hypothetical protein
MNKLVKMNILLMMRMMLKSDAKTGKLLYVLILSSVVPVMTVQVLSVGSRELFHPSFSYPGENIVMCFVF